VLLGSGFAGPNKTEYEATNLASASCFQAPKMNLGTFMREILPKTSPNLIALSIAPRCSQPYLQAREEREKSVEIATHPQRLRDVLIQQS
jgi:hypothetical protein